MIKVSIISFSYKRGLPKDFGEDGGGFVFDCRSIPNPYWDERLRKYTGRDEPVRAFMDAHKGEVAAFSAPSRNGFAMFLQRPRNQGEIAFTWLSVARADRAPLGLLRGGCGGPFARFVGR